MRIRQTQLGWKRCRGHKDGPPKKGLGSTSYIVVCERCGRWRKLGKRGSELARQQDRENIYLGQEA